MWRVKLYDTRSERLERVLLPVVHQLPQLVQWHGRYFQLRERGQYHEVKPLAAVSEQDIGGAIQDRIEDIE